MIPYGAWITRERLSLWLWANLVILVASMVYVLLSRPG